MMMRVYDDAFSYRKTLLKYHFLENEAKDTALKNILWLYGVDAFNFNNGLYTKLCTTTTAFDGKYHNAFDQLTESI